MAMFFKKTHRQQNDITKKRFGTCLPLLINSKIWRTMGSKIMTLLNKNNTSIVMCYVYWGTGQD